MHGQKQQHLYNIVITFLNSRDENSAFTGNEGSLYFRSNVIATIHYIMRFLIIVFFYVVFVAAPLVSSKDVPSVTPSSFLSDVVIPLSNNTWTLWSNDKVFTNLKAKVPGDLLSDLMLNGMINVV